MVVLPRVSKENLQEQSQRYTAKQEEAAAWFLIGVILFVIIAVLGTHVFKHYKDNIMAKMESLRHAYLDWKQARKGKQVSKKPDLETGLAVTDTVTVPKTAHVAYDHAQGPDVDSITENLTEEYLKKTTALMHGVA